MNSNFPQATTVSTSTTPAWLRNDPRDQTTMGHVRRDGGQNPLINYHFGNLVSQNVNQIFSDPGEDYLTHPQSNYSVLRHPFVSRQPSMDSPPQPPPIAMGTFQHQHHNYQPVMMPQNHHQLLLHHQLNAGRQINSGNNRPPPPPPQMTSYFSDNDVYTTNRSHLNNRNSGSFEDNYYFTNYSGVRNPPAYRQSLGPGNEYSNEFLDNTYKKLLRWSLCDANNPRLTDKLYVDCESPPEPEPVFSNPNTNNNNNNNYSNSIWTNTGPMGPGETSTSFWTNQFTKVSTNPLSRWRNRIRKKYETSDSIDDNDKSILKSLRTHQQGSSSNSKNSGANGPNGNNLLVQRLAIKEFERNRFLSRIEIDEFRLLISSLKSFIKRPTTETANHNNININNNNGLSGILCIQVIGAMGLQSSQSLIRDLYTVVEIDGTRKARTLIKTNTECFLWQEEFELETAKAKDLSLLLYQWNYTNKHRLCFYGNIDLKKIFSLNASNQMTTACCNDNYSRVSYRHPQRPFSSAYSDVDVHSNYTSLSDLIGCSGQRYHSSSRYNLSRCQYPPQIAGDEVKFEKIALQLEPNGIIYLELSYFPMSMAYLRVHASPSANFNIPLFGSPLNLVLNREKSKIPYVILKCIQEIDNRGLEICGIYKICGSLKLKMQLRNMFELIFYPIKDEMDLQDDEPNQDEIDLKPSKVPDIHVITAVLKDYLRELPEPLLTDGLYKMLLDAIQIKDQQVATKIGSRDNSHISNKTKLIYRILECIPAENQRVFFFILDHLKRVLMKNSQNKLSLIAIGEIFGPLLFYPSPSSAAKMDASLLQSANVTEMFTTILNIWPGQKKFHFTFASATSRRQSGLLSAHRHHSLDEYEPPRMTTRKFTTSQNYEQHPNPTHPQHPNHFMTGSQHRQHRSQQQNHNRRHLYKQHSDRTSAYPLQQRQNHHHEQI